MAWCGALTLHDREGAALHTVRYGRMPQSTIGALGEALAHDLIELLRRRPDLEVVKLADGAPDVWRVLDDHLDEERLGKEAFRLIDFWHVIEKLAAAARVLDPEQPNALIARWRRQLLEKKGAALRILRVLERSGMERVQVGEDLPMHEAITYLRNHKSQMRYAEARERGLPIGSGNVEATCKTIVAVRMKRAGARWKEESGNHVMQLRALATSDRLEPAMVKLFRRGFPYFNNWPDRSHRRPVYRS